MVPKAPLIVESSVPDVGPAAFRIGSNSLDRCNIERGGTQLADRRDNQSLLMISLNFFS